MVFKTAGRIKPGSSIFTNVSMQNMQTNVKGESKSKTVDSNGVDDDHDVTFGVFIAGKWTYDMVKKDMEGDGLADMKCVYLSFSLTLKVVNFIK